MSSVPPSEMAFRVLRLEQQIESYQRLHAQELEEIRRALLEVKEEVLALSKDVPSEKESASEQP
ncbi:MAG: hypothetical protein HY327_12575 [Chloroflexi bacterium]|nr:hypothetical protein [Chloroflexota bacterium]